ncbi:MAG: diguanylate cyclase [Geobacter sp.]|nr:diguanylate cyclase [Geobacter sp.]
MPFVHNRIHILIYHLLAVCMLMPLQSAEALEKVTLQLKWTHAFQFAGYYAAKEQGYYREAGLDVTIQEATPQTNPIQSVLEGRAQYGVGTSGLLLARSAGKPVVVLAVIFQQSPYEIFAAPHIRQVKDLIGKRLMLEAQTDELIAFLKKEGVSLDQLQLVPHSFDAAGLMRGQTEAISGYVSDEPYYLKKAKYPYQSFSPRSAGIDFYGDNLFTSELELKSHPERVEAFRAATMRGWRYAKEHRDDVINLILSKYSKRHTREYLHYESDQMIPLLQPNLIEIGYMNPGRWRHIADTYASIGLLPANFPLDGFLYEPPAGNLKRLYRYLGVALAAVFVASFIAIYIYRVNRRLAQIMKQNEQTTAALSESEELWRTIIKTSPDGIAITSMDGVVRQVSDKMFAMFGYSSADEIIGRNIFEFIDPEYHEKATCRIGMMLDGTYSGAADYLMIRKDGSRFFIEANAEILRDHDGRPRELFFIDRDITERKQTEARLRSLSVAIEQGSVSVVITDPLGTIQYVNPCFSAVTGYEPDEVIGGTPRLLKSGLTEQAVYVSLWNTLQEGKTWTGEFINKRKNGELFWEEAHIAPVFDSAGTVLQYVAVKLDITARKKVEEQVTHLAQYDALTDLPNRTLFSELLLQALALAQRENNCLAVMFVDLDRFKPVNDTYGHAVGDLLLNQVGKRMKDTVRLSDTLGRVGGDEFVVLLPKVEGPSDALLVAEKLRLALEMPFTIEDHVLQISACIGIALYPEHGLDEKTLFQHADLAMYHAKQRGRNAVQLFDGQMVEVS